MTRSSYVVAIGSNRTIGRGRTPRRIVADAMEALAADPLSVVAIAPMLDTAPLGPSLRRFANSAAIVETELDPPTLLIHLKRLESRFGRRRGQRWGSRPLDLDIILWDGGAWQDDRLVIPHPAFRSRDFVLKPLLAIVPEWRDPITSLTIRHLAARLEKRKPG